MTRIGTSSLDVLPLSLGGNVFGWTADRDASFAILDAFTAGGGDFIDTAAGASTYATEHGLAIIDTLDRIGQAHGISIAASAIAWLRAQPTVAAPIASASRVEQVADLLDGARTDLTADEIAELSAVSEWTPATV